jgi:GTP-binding protein HflX
VEDLKSLAAEREASLIVFGNDLSPAQGGNLEKRLGVRVIDRTQLIMDLFAVRARTNEARLQVELAQLQYSLPRLERLWTHLDRYRGFIGMRGPGETQLELDRREIERKITDRRKRLERVERLHDVRRENRQGRFTVGLVGYTNAGKSTLFNRLTGSSAATENRPFTTLDTKTSSWRIDDGCTVLLSDTIGFVRDLPHQLIASFRATLSEAIKADLILHVVDGSREDSDSLVSSVSEVLDGIGAIDGRRLMVVNKTDQVGDRLLLSRFGPHAHLVSARTGEGLLDLARAVAVVARADYVEASLSIPHAFSGDAFQIRSRSEVIDSRYTEDSCRLRVRAPRDLLDRYSRWIQPPASEDGPV